MKKLLFGLAMILGAACGAGAQEVALSYGAYTQMDAINCHKGFDKVNTAWGSINVGLYIPVAKGVKIGPSYSYSSAYTPAAEYDFGELGTYSLKSKSCYHVLLLNVKVQYYTSSIFNLYGHAGVGAVITNNRPKEGNTYNKGYFAGQISPLCGEVQFYKGGYVFGELGFGAQGLVQVGVKYEF